MFNGGNIPSASSAYRLGLKNSPKPVRGALQQSRAWMNRNPLIVKMGPTAFGFVFGDLLTQWGQYGRAAHRDQRPFSWDLTKAAAMAVAGASLAAPAGFYFLRWADAAILPGATGAAGAGAVALRVTLEQILGCMIWQASYLSLCDQYRKDAQWCAEYLQQRITKQQRQQAPLITLSA